MWRRSFLATTVALGGSVDDALAAMPAPMRSPLSTHASAELDALVVGLRAPNRAQRATALALVVRDVMLAIEQATLR